MKKKQILLWLAAVSICLSVFTIPNFAKIANAMTTIETNVTVASEGCTLLSVYGSYYSQAQAGLDRINEIRNEACKAGNVPDPRNPNRKLTPEDYVPIKWSKDLESIARIRAAEGGLAYSFLSSGHDRLNGKHTFSVSYNGISASAECLAYNLGTSMVSGINQWYDEKDDWVNQRADEVTGHYTSMIDPRNTYVGLGDFYTKAATFSNTLAGEFLCSSRTIDQTMQDVPLGNIMQKIEVKNSYIADYVLEGAVAVDTDKTITLTPRVKLANESANRTLWVCEPVTYTSNNFCATVTDSGIVTGHRSGEATIAVRSGSDGAVLASTKITVKCCHDKELLSATPSTCTAEGSKIYYCGTCRESKVEKVPKIAHSYTYGAVDSYGYITGICSACQDILKVIPPTAYKLYWKSNTSGSDSFSSAFPSSDPTGSTVPTGSTIYCWIDNVNGDVNYRDMVIESSDEAVLSVPETAMPNSSRNLLQVLAPGIVKLTIYPKYNPALKKILIARVGKLNSVDIAAADIELSHLSYSYAGRAHTPNVSVSYHDIPLTRGTDYTVSYANNIESGTATAIITGKGIFTGTVQKDFTIVPKSLTECKAQLSDSQVTYTGKAHAPAVVVTDGSKALVLDTDYAADYRDNIKVGTAKIIITGKGNYTGTVQKDFTIVPKSLAECKVQISDSQVTYTGKAHTPTVVVTDGSKALVLDTDYTADYRDNIKVGTAKIIITGKGNYAGTVIKSFTIKKTEEPSGGNQEPIPGTPDNPGGGIGDSSPNNPSDSPVKVSKITILAPSKKIAAGKKVSLTAKVFPSNAANKAVTWKSSNKKFASVNAKGIVTMKKAGRGKVVTITAIAKDRSKKKASIKMMIMKNAVTKVTIKGAPKTLRAGKSKTLKAIVSTNGKSANKVLKWTVSNSRYASVNAKGKVTAKRAGQKKTVTITAASTDGTNKKATVKIKIQ